MEGFKKINFAALCQLNCKRFRLEVEDQSGKKIKVILAGKGPDSARKREYLMILKAITK